MGILFGGSRVSRSGTNPGFEQKESKEGRTGPAQSCEFEPHKGLLRVRSGEGNPRIHGIPHRTASLPFGVRPAAPPGFLDGLGSPCGRARACHTPRSSRAWESPRHQSAPRSRSTWLLPAARLEVRARRDPEPASQGGKPRPASPRVRRPVGFSPSPIHQKLSYPSRAHGPRRGSVWLADPSPSASHPTAGVCADAPPRTRHSEPTNALRGLRWCGAKWAGCFVQFIP